MLGQSIGIEDVISTIKKMAIERGLNEEDLDGFLEKYALQFGCNSLLKNLVGADFHLKQAANTLDYAFSKQLALETLSETFESGEKILSVGCNVGMLETNLARKTNDPPVLLVCSIPLAQDLSHSTRIMIKRRVM